MEFKKLHSNDLPNRTHEGQQVQSEPIKFEMGVPQSSVLVPLIFIQLINDLHLTVQDHKNVSFAELIIFH